MRARRELATLVARRAVREGRRALYAVAPQPTVRRYLEGGGPHRLQVGCGPNLLPGWLNTDRDPVPGAAYLDARRPFPLPDGSFDYVFSEHTIEHLRYEDGCRLLAESFRVLRPGGRIRVATPDLAFVVGLHSPGRGEPEERYIRWSTDTFVAHADAYRPSFVIDNLFRNWGHRFLWDEETLRAALERAGFAGVRRARFGESDDPELAGVESHGETAGDREMIRLETLVLEAARP